MICTVVGGIRVPPTNGALPLPTTIPPASAIFGKANFWLLVSDAVAEDLASVSTILPVDASLPIKSILVLTPESVLIVICSTTLFCVAFKLFFTSCSKFNPCILFF